MLLTTVSGRSRLWVLDSVLEPVAGVALPKKVFTFRARWILLWCQVMLPHMFYLLKHLLLLYLVISKQSCNNLISTLIMSLYTSYVSLCILASSRIHRSILRRRTPHFWGGSVIAGQLHLHRCGSRVLNEVGWGEACHKCKLHNHQKVLLAKYYLSLWCPLAHHSRRRNV
jgi:hypothetical protein